MNFEFTDPQTPMERLFGGHCSINAFGRIEPGDGAKFATFLQRTTPPPITCVYLNTSGGSVPDGVESVRWNVSSRASRQIVNRFMNVVVPISTDEARQLAESQSFGLQIRFSSLADLFHGIGEVTIDEGGRGKLDTLVSMFS